MGLGKKTFDLLFEEMVASPLEEQGFQRKGLSLYLDSGDCQFAWIRGAGRLASPGTIAHIVAFRHGFLRDKQEEQPEQQPRYPEHYPWILDAEELCATGPSDWVFDPKTHMNLPYGRYEYADLTQEQVSVDLRARRVAFLEHYVPWGRSMGLEEAREQMHRHRTEWWIARLWFEDYASREAV